MRNDMKTIQELTIEFNDDDRNIINKAYELLSSVDTELDEHRIQNNRNLEIVYIGSPAALYINMSDIANTLYTLEMMNNIHQLKTFEDDC